MKSILTLFFAVIINSLIFGNTYYVSLSGSDLNSGTSQIDEWRTLTHAAATVTAGDTVYIKAGNYGAENVVFLNNGTSSNPIIYLGYQFVPGDNPDLDWEYGDSFDATVMPLLDGADSTGTGITLNYRSHIVVKNIQIKNYQTGLYAYSAHDINIENIATMSMGNVDLVYNGKGIAFGSYAYDNIINNCIVYNACAEGLSITGNNNTISNCRIYSDDNSTLHSSMDYYIHINGNNNTLLKCYAERVGDLDHNGHGIGLKTNCQNNIMDSCIAKGFGIAGFELSYRGVQNNILKNCKTINCGYGIRDGASNNIIRNCTSIGAKVGAVLFNDTSEDGGPQYCGKNNRFENCVFKDSEENVIDFFWFSTPTIADSNKFVNCVFDGGKYLFNCDRLNDENTMINCIVTNVDHYKRSQYPQAPSYINYTLNFDFENCDFWSNGFTAPSGTNVYTFNPEFVLPGVDYHLTLTSPCVDAGTLVNAPTSDFEGSPRPQGLGIDIGAYETTPGSIASPNTFYVSLTGNDLNTGTSPMYAWRTITHAAATVTAGDTVYIKAGNYGAEHVVFLNNGTLSNPIIFEGYKNTPGDNPDIEWGVGDMFDPTMMPLLDGVDRTGIGVTLHNRSHIVLKNIQIENYQVGLFAYAGHYIVIDNILTKNLGNKNLSNDGRGIVFGSYAGNNTLENCVVYNACTEGISITGNDHVLSNCRVYSDDSSTVYSSMDYYIQINGNMNTIEGCHSERIGNLSSNGNGISIKSNSQNNTVSNCVSKGFGVYGFELSYRGVQNNILENCTAINCGYGIREGASNNIIRNCTSTGAKLGSILFMDTSEDGGAQYCGKNNRFENCIFKDSEENVIDFFWYSTPTIADSNKFVNCVFDGGKYLFNCDRLNDENTMINCIVTNVDYYKRSQYPQAPSYINYTLNFDFENCDFWSNGFTAPSGTNVYTFNPEFVLPGVDYHLTLTSPCVDAGTLVNAPTTDFEGSPRPQGLGIDIGAYELTISNKTDNNSIFGMGLGSQVKLYPNPTIGFMNLVGDNLEVIGLYNIIGQNKTGNVNIIKVNENNYSIDMSLLASGVYILKTNEGNFKLYKK